MNLTNHKLRRSSHWAEILRSENGSGLFEFAVTFPVFLLLLFCFLQACLALYSDDLDNELAHMGTRYAMYRGAGCPSTSNPTCEATAAQVNTYVASQIKSTPTGTGYPNLACSSITPVTTYAVSGSTSFAATNSEAPGGKVKVTVTCVFPIQIPLVPKNGLTFSSSSTMPILQ